MSTKQWQILKNMGNIMQWMAPYAGGSVPATTDPLYDNWVKWIQLGQQDAANRTFWRRFLIPQVITITKDVDYIVMPDDFNKINGMYCLDVNGINWGAPNNEDGQRCWVYLDPTTATWRCKFLGFTPTETVTTAILWYFYNPPMPTAEADLMYLDGEMIGFYALKEHFRKNSQPGSLDDARLEYENRFEDLSTLEVIPSPQELISWTNFSTYKNQSASERQFYKGRRRTRL